MKPARICIPNHQDHPQRANGSRGQAGADLWPLTVLQQLDLSHPGREQEAPAAVAGSTISRDKHTYFPLGTFQDLNKVTVHSDRTEQDHACKVQWWLLQEPGMMPIQRSVRCTQ